MPNLANPRRLPRIAAARSAPRFSVSDRRRDPRGLLANIVITVAVAALVVAALQAFGLNTTAPQIWPRFAPPQHAIGFVWIGLFALMGAARWFALTSGYASARADARAVVVLIGLCLAYPFYTHAIPSHFAELAGNAVSFVYASWLLLRLRTTSAVAAACVAAVAAWIAFATVLVVALVRLNGWAV